MSFALVHLVDGKCPRVEDEMCIGRNAEITIHARNSAVIPTSTEFGVVSLSRNYQRELRTGETISEEKNLRGLPSGRPNKVELTARSPALGSLSAIIAALHIEVRMLAKPISRWKLAVRDRPIHQWDVNVHTGDGS